MNRNELEIFLPIVRREYEDYLGPLAFRIGQYGFPRGYYSNSSAQIEIHVDEGCPEEGLEGSSYYEIVVDFGHPKRISDWETYYKTYEEFRRWVYENTRTLPFPVRINPHS